MNNHNTSSGTDGFQVEDPLGAFTTHSNDEIRRWRETDPDFNAALHQQAVALVLNRLKTLSTTAGMARGAAN